MKSISFYPKRTDTLHVETPGAIINIHVGLTDRFGREVINVSILPDDETRGGDEGGRIWRRIGNRIVLLKGQSRKSA